MATNKAIIAAWEEWALGRHEASTVKKYRGGLLLFSAESDRLLTEITRQEVEDWCERGSPKAAGKNSRLKPIKLLARYLYDRRQAECAPDIGDVLDIPAYREHRQVPRAPRMSDLDVILEAACPTLDTEHDIDVLRRGLDRGERVSARRRLIVAMIFLLGLRRAEVAVLRWEDLDLQGRWATLRRRHAPESRPGHIVWEPGVKGRRERTVPIPEKLVSEIFRYRDRVFRGVVTPTDPVFPSAVRPGRPISGRTVYSDYSVACAEAGVAAVNPHGGRHAYGRFMASQGVPVTQTRDSMGHGSLSTTQLYSDQIADDRQRSVDRAFHTTGGGDSE